ncbi:GTP-binding protein 10 [Acropora cervicornis]|uniref:GTP-binding protein 10 n=1 Tax=Acropora cervicornis TaxID=6130 RepID=A0AAD9PU18_ACRCE|nr:GTP-binding protein 10 [Acropora cervicornis]
MQGNRVFSGQSVRQLRKLQIMPVSTYRITTMRPNIGMVEYPDHSQVSVADLPGLIEGASVNRGLGHSFLKHTQKARALALVVDIDGFHLSDKFPARTPLQNVFILLKELVLYDKELLRRPKMLVVTKLDKKGNLLPVLEEIRTSSPVTQEKTNLMSLADELSTIRFDSVIPVSAATSFGLDDLRDKMKTIL